MVLFFCYKFPSLKYLQTYNVTRGRSRTAATFKVELYMIIVNDFQPLTIITKSSTLDGTAVLDQPLVTVT